MIRKHILVPDRVRRPPKTGFSWLDRRFFREHAERLTHDAIFLYLFLCAVSDKHGLSYYSDTGLGSRLRMGEASVVDARDELLRHDLIAYQAPLYQVLELRSSPARQPARSRGAGDAESIASIFRALGQAGRDQRG